MEKEVKKEVVWKKEPADKDYPAAVSYLSLLFPKVSAEWYGKRLASAPMVEFASKDIFRASNLPELDSSNYHVRRFADKIATGDSISPILLVRDEQNRTVIIADGFHRLCAAYLHDEDLMVPCKLV